MFTNSNTQMSHTFTIIRANGEKKNNNNNNNNNNGAVRANGNVRFTFCFVMGLNTTIVTSCDSLTVILVTQFFHH